jgi:Ca2+-binding RTX toxin-like protein
MNPAMLETLESRQHLAAHVAMSGSTLLVRGTAGNDYVTIETVGSKVHVNVYDGIPSHEVDRSFNASRVRSIKVDAKGGDDEVLCYSLDASRINLRIDGGAGRDYLYGAGGPSETLIGGPGSDTLYGSARSTIQANDGEADSIYCRRSATVRKDALDRLTLS